MESEAQLGSAARVRGRLLRSRLIDHQARTGDDSVFVRFDDAAIDASAVAEVVGVDDTVTSASPCWLIFQRAISTPGITLVLVEREEQALPVGGSMMEPVRAETPARRAVLWVLRLADLLRALTESDLRFRYGRGPWRFIRWLFEPVALVGVYLILVSVVLDRPGEAAGLSLACAVIPFQLVMLTIGNAMTSLEARRPILLNMAFKRMLHPDLLGAHRKCGFRLEPVPHRRDDGDLRGRTDLEPAVVSACATGQRPARNRRRVSRDPLRHLAARTQAFRPQLRPHALLPRARPRATRTDRRGCQRLAAPESVDGTLRGLP